MASRNYEVVFLLRAQADAAVAQIHGASSALSELEKKSEALQAALADLENMKAYQKSVEALAAKLKEAQEREAAATDSVKTAKAAREAAEEALRKNLQAYEEQRRAIAQLKDEQKLEIAQMKAAGSTQQELNQVKERHVEELNRENEKLRELDRARKAAKATLEGTKRAEQEAEQQKRQSTNATREAERVLEQERQKLQGVIDALKKMGVDTTSLEKAAESLNAELKETGEELDRLQDRAERMQTLEGVVNTLRAASMAASAFAAAARPVWEMMGNSLQSAAALEKQIDAVRAVSSASAEETARITEEIRRVGATTVYTAEEAAQAAQNMALAGWDSGQILSGLQSVVNLAAAAGESLPEMTTIITDGMNAFGVAGEAAATKFADVLARAATSSSTNVGLMGQALSYVETTAGNLDYSIEDVSLALAAMANNALKGGVAGAALNTILTRMSGANAVAAKQMEAMGLSMYDNNQQAKPLLQFLNELRKAFQDFGGDAQAAQLAAYRLAGQRGMRGVLSIVNQSEEQWKSLVEQVYAYQGAANQISTTRLDNYSGKLQLLSDAWTDLKITLGSQLLPAATDGVEALTELVNGANSLAGTAQPLVLWATGASAAVLGMGKALGIAATAAQGLYFAMKLLPEGVTLASILTTAGPIAAGVAAAAGALLAVFGSEDYQGTKAGTQYLEEQEKSFESAAQVYDRSRTALEEAQKNGDIAQAWKSTDAGYEAEIRNAERALEEAEEQRKGFIEGLQEKGHYEMILDPITQEWKLNINAMTTTEAASLAAYERAMEAQRTKLTELKRDRADLHAQALKQIREETGAQELTLESYMNIEAALQSLGEAWAEAWGKTYEAYSGVFGLFEQVEEQDASLDEMMAGLESQEAHWEAYARNLEILRGAAEDAGLDIEELWRKLGESGDAQSAAWLQELADSLGSLEKPDTSKLAELVDLYDRVTKLRESATDVYTMQDSQVQQALEQFERDMDTAVQETAAYDQARAAMLETLAGYTDTLAAEGNEALRAVERLGERMRTALYPPNTSPLAGGGTSLPNVSETLNGAKTGQSGILKLPTYSPGTDKLLKLAGAYAGGTRNASPGLSLVGEDGPELMMMRGGEQILSARESRNLLRAQTQRSDHGIAPITVNLTFQGQAERGQGEEIAKAVEGAVRRALRERDIRERRAAYA